MYSKRYMYDIGRIGCLELLENGLVNAFEEALQLMEMNDEMKKKAEHGHDKEMPHDFRKDKDAMHIIIEMLKKTEAADRTGGFEENYNARLVLANHFLDVKGYHWLAEYLYKSCYKILENEDDESRRLKALQLLGLLEERRDNPDVALRYMEKAIVMANKASLNPNDPIKKELFQQLIEMYRKLGSRYFEREDDFTLAKHSKSVFYYKRAALLAKTYDTIESQATSYGLLGRARMKFHDYKKALKNFEMYLSLSQECGDKYSVCNAYFALSEIHKRIGNLEQSIQVLTKCQSQAKENGFLVPLIFSSVSFGQLYTAQRQYLEAYENFEVAYRTLIFYCDKLPNKIKLRKLCRVMSGVGRAHCSFNRLVGVLQEPPEKALSQLLTWRDTSGPFDGRIIMKQDHLINLDKEEMEDEETKKFALIQQLIKEELNMISTQET